MSNTKKKLRGDDSMRRSSEDSDEESPDVYMGNEEIQVDFEGRNPEDSDFHGIKALLQQLFLKAHVNLSDLADIIIGQGYVGSVIKQCESDTPEDDDEDMDSDINDVFGITTVIPLKLKKESESIKQIKDLLSQLAEKHAGLPTRSLIEKVLAANTGLLLSERLINIPPQISVPLFETLQSELTNAKDKNEAYRFDYYLMICKMYKSEGSKKSNKKNKHEPELVWSNPEEENLQSLALDSFEFSVKSESDSGLTGNWLEHNDTMTPYRRVIILEGNQLGKVIENIKAVLV